MPTSTPTTPMPGFKFGCDPELFIVDSKGQGVCPDGLIPGTKSEPYTVTGGAIQQDGMAAEFNINPAESFEEFWNNITKVTRTLKMFIPADHRLVGKSCMTFSPEVWEKASAAAKELGCSPDFNAWTGSVNPPPNGRLHDRMRTASGHLHIGWTDDGDPSDEQHVIHCRDLVKQLDYYLGAWSTQYDTDQNRRKLYGKAGACRFKTYGVEYRVLGNFWLENKTMAREVWNRMQRAIWKMRDNFMPEKYFDFNDAVIQTIDNTHFDPYTFSMLQKRY